MEQPKVWGAARTRGTMWPFPWDAYNGSRKASLPLLPNERRPKRSARSTKRALYVFAELELLESRQRMQEDRTWPTKVIKQNLCPTGEIKEGALNRADAMG